MSAVYVAKVGNKGRVVIPAGLRESQGWAEETVLVFVDESDSVRLVSRDDLERQVLDEMAGSPSLADELIAERRAEALQDAEALRDAEPSGTQSPRKRPSERL